MMRARNLPTKEDSPHRVIIATFFDIDVDEVTVEPQPDAFSIYIEGNVYAIKKYKEINPWGNTVKPQVFNFNQRLLVMWNGKKIQPL